MLRGIILLCAIILVAVIAILGIRLLGDRSDPTATPTSTAMPTATPSPIDTPAPQPSATLPPETSPDPSFQAHVTLTTSAAEVEIGDLLTVTVVISNTGPVTFGNLHYQLLGWEPAFGAPTGASAGHEVDLSPGQDDATTFLLEAVQSGAVQLYATVTATTREDPPAVKPVASENVVKVSVIQ